MDFEVAPVCIKPERNLADLPSHEPSLGRPYVADGKINISAQEISDLVRDDQLKR
jgi:hypothetical protein